MPTIQDVADECRVSITTVSMVINNGPRQVNAQTRQRVLDAIARLNYRPSSLARGLATRRTNTLGVVFGQAGVPVFQNSYVSPILSGFMEAAGAAEYHLTLCCKAWQQGEGVPSLLRDQRVDGILAVSPATDSDMLTVLAEQALPVVAVASPFCEVGIPFVYGNDVMGASLAANHLLSLGHRRIAHLLGDSRRASVAARKKGFLDAMAAANVAVPPEYVVPGSYSGKTAPDALQRLLSLPTPPTAIFAGNDALAVTVLSAARAQGVSVPDQLSVVGYDDFEFAALTTPPLTTVRQPLTQIGRTAAQRLIALLTGEIQTGSQLLDVELVIRATTAPPLYLQ